MSLDPSIATPSEHASPSTLIPSSSSPSSESSHHYIIHDESSPPLPISHYDLLPLIHSLFTSMNEHSSSSSMYTLTLSPHDIHSYHHVLFHYIQSHHIPMDDMTHTLLSHGCDCKPHYTWGEMSEKRETWLKQHTHHKQQSSSQQHHSTSIQLDTIVVKPVTPKTIPTTATAATSTSETAKWSLKEQISKYAGQHVRTPQMMPWWDQFWAFIGSFLGILAPAFLNFEILVDYANKPELAFLIASFGATAVLIFSAIGSDLAQPRSLIGGHMLSALVGVIVRKIIPTQYTFIACALAVSISIAVMNLTKTLHPPGGATALIAVIPNKLIQDLGFLYVLLPVGSGAVVMLLIALITNNIPRRRTWPRYWI